MSIHGEDAGNAIQIAVKAHFEYLFNKMNFETETKNQKEQRVTYRSTYWDKINRQFLFELMNYWNREDGRN